MATWLPILRRRGCSVLFYSYINHGYKDAYYQEIIGTQVGVNQHIYIDGWVVLDLDDASVFDATFSTKLESEAYVSYFTRRCRRASDALFTFGHSVRSRNFSNTCTGELLELFSEFSSLTIQTIPFLTTIVQIQQLIENKLTKSLSLDWKLPPGSEEELSNRIQQLIVAGEEVPLAAQSIRILRDLAFIIRRDYPDLAAKLSQASSIKDVTDQIESIPAIAQRISAYLEQFDFLGTDYYVGEPLSRTNVLEQISALLHETIHTKDDSDANIAELMRSLTPPALSILKAAQELHFLRQHRIEALFKSGRDARTLLTEIGRRMGVTYDELLALQFTEVFESLTQEQLAVPMQTVFDRIHDYGVFIENGDPRIVTGENLSELRAVIHLPEVNTDVLCGVTAVPGETEGYARVVTILDDISSMRAGEILIAPMTSPYHVPAMTIASAIVTDEGGILSHAAIISRELGLPCIVGTKNATDRINTGDRIRVVAKASGGLIEIVSRADATMESKA